MGNTHRFDGKSKIYDAARPKYNEKLFDFFENTLDIHHGAVFADVGSGTGIFSEQLLNRGYRVFAIEPNSDMRKTAEEKLSKNPDFTSVNGEDGNMNLPDNIAECITAAQAFHWFDPTAFKKECRRVLNPNGKVIIIYNSRDINAECTRALADLHNEYSPDFHGFSNGISDEKCKSFFDGKCSIFSADNSQTYTKTAYINRVLSSSYALKPEDSRYEEYLRKIGGLFDEFSVSGQLTVPVYTLAYAGEV